MHTLFMQRCIELAMIGRGSVLTNPLVGCVIVCNNRIIGEGWHMQYGGNHAEVNAINNVKDKSLLKESILFVNLEPCCHFGKTAPCTNLIAESGIKHVVVGMPDPNPLVMGKGILQLKNAGITVEVGIEEQQCMALNARFINFIKYKKPYVILKWAQTTNGFIAPDANKLSKVEFETQRHITGKTIQKLAHKWRTYEDAILIGTNTAITDNPALNAREWPGKNPLRIIIDRNLKLHHTLKIFDNTQPTLIINSILNKTENNTTYLKLDFNDNMLNNMLNHLYQLNICSLIVEGGSILLNSFIKQNIFNEAVVFTSNKHIHNGIAAPNIYGKLADKTIAIDGVIITRYINDLFTV